MGLTTLFAITVGSTHPVMSLDVDPFYGNRQPNAPTLLYPAGNTLLTLQSPEATIQLNWQNNGDPDGDPVNF